MSKDKQPTYRKWEKVTRNTAYFDTYDMYAAWRKAMLPAYTETEIETLSDKSIVVRWTSTEYLYG